MALRIPLALLLLSALAPIVRADDDCAACEELPGSSLNAWMPKHWWHGESGLRPIADWPLLHWTDVGWRHPGQHTDPDDPERHVGLGSPLVGTSWLNRPTYVGWFLGGMFGGELIPRRVDQGSGAYGGYHLGADFDHYWGMEARLGFASVDLTLGGVPTDATSSDWFADGQLLYYPWGDAYWRPYLSVGLGLAGFRFFDDNGQRVSDTLVQMPIGFGVKCNFQRWVALRAGVTDNIAFGGTSVSTLQNVSLTCGVEVRFGSSCTGYYPWHPGGV